MIGNVYLARDPKNKEEGIFCIKRMNAKVMAEKRLFPSLKRELKILNEIINVPGCIKLVDVLYDDSSISYVFPFYPHGDLHSFFKANSISKRERELPEEFIRAIFVQVVQTFKRLHKMGIIHRDLKQENILVEVGGD
jgi:serine/threonine protein kinase